MAQQIFLTIESLILAETDTDCILSPEEYIASYPRDSHKIYHGHGCYLGKYTTLYLNWKQFKILTETIVESGVNHHNAPPCWSLQQRRNSPCCSTISCFLSTCCLRVNIAFLSEPFFKIWYQFCKWESMESNSIYLFYVRFVTKILIYLLYYCVELVNLVTSFKASN
jgi:hypothetical protein